LFSLSLKQYLTIDVLLVIYIRFLHVRLAHVVYMLEVMEESQENTEILRHHEAHGRFVLLRKGSADEKTPTPKHRTKNQAYFSWLPSYRSVK